TRTIARRAPCRDALAENPLPTLRDQNPPPRPRERPRHPAHASRARRRPARSRARQDRADLRDRRKACRQRPDAGLEVGPGEFVGREAGSRHVAFAPEGVLMLAVFQIPNRFFERDGRITDANGQDWETLWGQL